MRFISEVDNTWDSICISLSTSSTFTEPNFQSSLAFKPFLQNRENVFLAGDILTSEVPPTPCIFVNLG